MGDDTIRILLIGDNEDDYILIRRALSRSDSPGFTLDRASTREDALRAVSAGIYDACMVECESNGEDSLDLIREVVRNAPDAPVILLTAQDCREMHAEALREGASDCLAREWIDAPLLERSIKYAIERKRIERELRSHREKLRSLMREQTLKSNTEFEAEISQPSQIEEGLRQGRELADHLLESLEHPLIVVDAGERTIEIANSAAVACGLIKGHPCSSTVHGRDAPCEGGERACPLEAVKKAKKPVTMEHIHYDGGGNPRDVEIHAYPVFDESGAVVRVIEHFHDITDRRRLEESLRDKADRMKLFAYSVSHDLRGPIIGICGLTRRLFERYHNVLDEKGKLYCSRILAASEQAALMIEEINLYIRTKETPLRIEAVSPEEILREIRDEYADDLLNRRIFWIQPAAIPRIRADKIAVTRVFRNLVDNAVKYGGRSLSRIEIGCGEYESHYMFSVGDDGIGIRQEDAERIFKLFERRTPSREIEGAGLGLSIVREIVAKHRGAVWVEAGEDEGAIFYFTISKRL